MIPHPTPSRGLSVWRYVAATDEAQTGRNGFKAKKHMPKIKAKKRSTARFAAPWRVEIAEPRPSIPKGFVTVMDANDEPAAMRKNVNLIAAAPELLSHLEALTQLAKLVVINWPTSNLADTVNCLAQAANDASDLIAKATAPIP